MFPENDEGAGIPGDVRAVGEGGTVNVEELRTMVIFASETNPFRGS